MMITQTMPIRHKTPRPTTVRYVKVRQTATTQFSWILSYRRIQLTVLFICIYAENISLKLLTYPW